MRTTSKTYWILVSGPLACWTPPEFRVERISALLPSHDAWEGLLKTILGHWRKGTTGRQFRWVVEEVRVLNQPEYHTIPANEMKFNNATNFAKPHFGVSTPRTTVYLRNPAYLLKVRMELTQHAVPGVDTIRKFEEMFERRMSNGQQWGQPCLGLRELMADVEIIEERELHQYPAALVNHHLGVIYYGTDWEDANEPQYFVPLDIKNGLARYPTWDEVRRTGFRRATRKAVG